MNNSSQQKSSPLGEDRRGLSFRIFASAFLLIAGVGVAIAGFCVPPLGEISDSVLMFTAEALVMAGAFVGIDVLVDKRIANRLGKGS